MKNIASNVFRLVGLWLLFRQFFLRYFGISLMKTKFVVFCSFFVYMFLFGGLLHAAPPTTFDGWNENAGAITAACPTGFQCTESVNDQGILQRTLLSPTGEEYIQLIVSSTDQNGTVVTGESFIKAGGTTLNGISAKQIISQSGADQFDSQSILNVGWANDGTTPAVELSQNLTTNYQGIDYSHSFAFNADHDAAGNSIGTYTDVRQTLLNTSAIDPNITPTGQDVQTFVFRRANGSRVANAGQAVLPAAQGGQMGMMGGGGMGDGMAGGGAGGTLNWNAGDDVQVIWIGQLCEGCGDGAGMMDGGGGGGGGGMMGGGGTFNATFSYQSFDNLVDAADPISTASILTTNPFDWPDPPFGAQPTLQ